MAEEVGEDTSSVARRAEFGGDDEITPPREAAAMLAHVDRDKRRILLCCTGSVASVKVPALTRALLTAMPDCVVRIVASQHALHFFKRADLPPECTLYCDNDEWTVRAYKDRLLPAAACCLPYLLTSFRSCCSLSVCL